MSRLKFFLMNLIFSPVYEDGDILVCYASQTGTAARLAEQSAHLLRAQGQSVSIDSLAALQPGDLGRFKQVLMIVSTAGDGEIPDAGQAFYQQLQDYPQLNTPVSLLALGDKSYAKFCAAGIAFHNELLRLGATVDQEPLQVDGNPMPIWQQWMSEQGSVSTEMLAESAANTVLEKELMMELVDCQPLHQQAERGNQAYRLSFRIDSETPVTYQPGDLLGITPPGETRERLYSIASAPSARENHMELCVGLLSYSQKGETVYGRCSRYLTHELQAGEPIAARWKPGGGLTLPESDQPLIMIATGAGIAPMACILQERKLQQHTGDNWLIFGNRSASADYYYRDEFEALHADGHIQHLETAFSRDGDKKVYVQNVLGQNPERLRDWLVNRNGRLYVCGRSDLKQAVMECIISALSTADSTDGAETLANQMVADHQICFELF